MQQILMEISQIIEGNTQNVKVNFDNSGELERWKNMPDFIYTLVHTDKDLSDDLMQILVEKTLLLWELFNQWDLDNPQPNKYLSNMQETKTYEKWKAKRFSNFFDYNQQLGLSPWRGWYNTKNGSRASEIARQHRL